MSSGGEMNPFQRKVGPHRPPASHHRLRGRSLRSTSCSRSAQPTTTPTAAAMAAMAIQWRRSIILTGCQAAGRGSVPYGQLVRVPCRVIELPAVDPGAEPAEGVGRDVQESAAAARLERLGLPVSPSSCFPVLVS